MRCLVLIYCIFQFGMPAGLSQSGHIFCGSEEYEDILIQDYKYRSSLESEIEKYIKFRNRKERKTSIITVPVVFHIIHNNGPENLTEERIFTALSNLNNAFANKGKYSHSEGVDTKIQFCLAQRDEEDKEFSGYIRHKSEYTDMSLPGSFQAIEEIATFDRSKYLNIQIVQNVCLSQNCNILGFGGAYRLVVEAKTVGVKEGGDVTLIHEMGHALGLFHTFRGGCKNDDCLRDGDLVCDTPPDNRNFEGCNNLSNSCHTDEDDTTTNNPYRPTSLGGAGDQPDDNINYMDYNESICKSHFTQGQSDRMQFIINERYAPLLLSKVCLPPCDATVVADFDLPDSIEVGSELSIINTSLNANVYQWSVNGEVVSNSVDLSYSFNDVGLYTIALEAYSNDTLCEPQSIIKTISVFCPIQACIEYEVIDQYLHFEHCTENGDNFLWTIYSGENEVLYESTEPQDSYYINNVDYVRLCLTASSEFCEDEICEYITIANDGSEICNNGIDDDGDGLIDLFDPDCSCNDTAYQAQCPVDCEIIPDSFPDIKMKLKWESEISGIGVDTRNVFIFLWKNNLVIGFTNRINHDDGSQFGRPEYLSYFLSGSSGMVLDSFDSQHDYMQIHSFYSKDNVTYGFFLGSNASGNILLSRLGDDGSYIEKTISIMNSYRFGIHDLNSDGNAEVVYGTSIYDAESLSFLGQGNLGTGCYGNLTEWYENDCFFSHTVVADFLPDMPGLEIAAGNTVYNLEINNTNGETGNIITSVQSDEVFDGASGVGDIDGDGLLDVIVVRSNNVSEGETGVAIWNPVKNELIAKAAGGERGSVPFIGDVDGDCLPEIGVVFVNELRMYKYNGTQELELLYIIPTSDRSGWTGVTMFDFNQDGNNELVYRDETDLRIIDGRTGVNISTFPINSGTGKEYPVIADVDNDGQAEILVTGYINDPDSARVFCFESATAPWAPARSVWNQYAYNPTQVNDDLTIPRYPQNPAQPLQGTENCPRETCNTPYNNFMVQATYRTQEGCYVWPELQRDLSVTASSRCVGDSLEICFYASSTDTATIRNGVKISCYAPPWDNGSDNLIDVVTVTQDTTCIMMPVMDGLDSMMIVINDGGGYYPPNFPNTDINECDYTNNEFILPLNGPDFTIDIVDQVCTPDSLIFYIATDNIGQTTDVSCIGGGYYYINPSTDPDNNLIEITRWCFDYDSTRMAYNYQDTFRVAIPHPIDHNRLWWTINEGGYGPGYASSIKTEVYECLYDNNVDSVYFDVSDIPLNLGPDLTKCKTEVLTLNAGEDYQSYLWSDLTTDSIYSAVSEGLHYVEAIDQCGRVYRDTVKVAIAETFDLALPQMLETCDEETIMLSVDTAIEAVYWSPADQVSCDTCHQITVLSDTLTTLIVQGRMENCIRYDTMAIQYAAPVVISKKASICEGDSILFYDRWVKESASYEKHFNCDSTVTLDLVIHAPTTSVFSHSACESYTWNGVTYTDSGTYTHLATNSRGCDSTATLELTINETLTSMETVATCDSFTWNGDTYTESGQYEYTMSSTQGCDSTAYIDLTIHNSIHRTESMQACDSIYWDGKWFFEDGFYTKDTLSRYGCDSSVTLSLDIHQSKEALTSQVSCEEYYWNGNTYSESGIYTYQTTTAQGCDSIITLDLTINESLQNTTAVNSCDQYEWDGDIYAESGFYEKLYTSVQGCDSIAYLDLTINHSYHDTIQQVACHSFNWKGSTYSESGMYPFTAISTHGCDSIITLDLTIRSTVEVIDTVTAYNSFTWHINKRVYRSSGIYKEFREHPSGCDSLYVLVLTINKKGLVSQPNVIKPGTENGYFLLYPPEAIVSLNIYDRWGSLVYSYHQGSQGWDGRINGRDVIPGVYVWQAKISQPDGTLVLRVGDVTVIAE